MRVKLQLVISHDDGREETVTDVIALDKNGCVPPFTHGVSTRPVRLMKPDVIRTIPNFRFQVFSEVPCR
jgi:hypothetical protein